MHLLPDAHQSFLQGALPILQSDTRVQAVIISGSAVTGGMDVWSDLDLVVLVEDSAEIALTAEHFARHGEQRVMTFLHDLGRS
ncbi:MAG: nucleotidyltransferase domain-containing protein [Myxococcota bacterium]